MLASPAAAVFPRRLVAMRVGLTVNGGPSNPEGAEAKGPFVGASISPQARHGDGVVGGVCGRWFRCRVRVLLLPVRVAVGDQFVGGGLYSIDSPIWASRVGHLG